eukprot:CAMPEP_0113486990 /NCGR_PEP_ID=MMETSP0014_2-20120614/25281_1 /TAXON_ID=2857 /ORGANISM="Nitzschia sp." /LENGTH=453 /DNA_ID=CAMNT_0000380679 /DNA_START=38 /DNA_END=1396 /DNA_ORIENTATION=- /assembly_acc=CAM_ASM_000159
MAAVVTSSNPKPHHEPFHDSNLSADSGESSLSSSSCDVASPPSSDHKNSQDGGGNDSVDGELSKTLHRMPKFFVREVLGKGPARFAIDKCDDIKTDLDNLSKPQRQAFDDLKEQLEAYSATKSNYQGKRSDKNNNNNDNKNADLVVRDEWYLRYLYDTARKDAADGSEEIIFHPTKAYKSMKRKVFKQSGRFLNLRIHKLEKQLQTRTLFPVPGLKTYHQDQPLDMFYMRPALYFPKVTSTKTIIDNLVYVMNTMMESSHSTKHGIGFIANMNNWQFKNFETNYCLQFMQALQGMMVPAKVELFLIVNPPAWFGVIWKIMKPMLAPSFRRKVKICNESLLSRYLQRGYQKFLPDDFETGRASTKRLVNDFITYRRYVERDYNDDATQDEFDDYDDAVEREFNHSGSSCSHQSTGSCDESIDSADIEEDDDDDDASIHADIDAELQEHLKAMDD